MVVTQAAVPANPGVELPGLAAASLWGIAPSLAAEYAAWTSACSTCPMTSTPALCTPPPPSH